MRQFSLKWRANLWSQTKIYQSVASFGSVAMFCVLNVVNWKLNTKKQHHPFFLADFNNLLTINKNCLNRHHSKYKTRNWPQFDQFLLDFEDSHLVLTRIVTNLDRFKKKLDNISSNSNYFCVRHWISVPKLSRVNDSSCIFTAFYVSVHQKALYWRP